MRATGDNERPANSPPAANAAARGLDWFNLFVANIQTGFGPFIAVYLSSQSWTQTAIGLALSIGTVSSMASQVPAGALVDAIENKTRVAAFSVLVFTASALMFAVHPIPLFVYLAEILHGISSCTLGPGDRGDESGARRPFRHGLASRAQRPLCGGRQRSGRGTDGRMRAVRLGACGVLSDRGAHVAGAACIAAFAAFRA